MNHDQLFFKHMAGVASFMGWCRRWAELPQGVNIAAQVATLGPVPCQRFGLAWPKRRRYGKHPSLLYQKTESQWMENICWERAVLEPFTDPVSALAAIVLVARKVAGDDMKFMTFPVFALRIPLSVDQAEIWARQAPVSLEMRLLGEDEDHASVSPPFVVLPLTIAAPGDAVFSPDELSQGTPFHELLERRLRQEGREENPGFQGTAQSVDDPYLKSQAAYRASLGKSTVPPEPVA